MSTRRARRAAAARRAAGGPLPPRIHAIPVTGENSLAPDESVAEAEDALGQNDWIDPDSGELAEGEAPPRLQDD